jgi:hypothetical protein
MSIYEIISTRLSEIKGRTADANECKYLIENLSELNLDFILDIIQTYPLIGCNFVLSDFHDASGLGVDMIWMPPLDIVEESTKFYPGIVAKKYGYLPIGSCLIGSGDPYFIECKKISNTINLLRIPHTAVFNDDLVIESIEFVSSLIDFFKWSSILNP